VIYTRVKATVGPTLTPQSLAAASDERLRRAGLSANKLASLRDLAAKVSDGTVALTRSSVRSDDELIERLTTVRGIGPWTAQMYVLFQLRRLDVWPVGGLGVRLRLRAHRVGDAYLREHVAQALTSATLSPG
jgi:DNA-3-methyladenine glycosylase II